MNVLSKDKIERLEALFAAGFTIRQAARKANVNRQTAQRYQAKGPIFLCPCGKPKTHKGWCKIRVAKSPNRQKFLERFASGGIKRSTRKRWQREQVDANTTVELLLSLRRDRAIRLSQLRATRAQSISASEMIERVLNSLPTSLPQDVRDEIKQDLFVAILEGSVDFVQIKAAIPEYIRRYYAMYPSKFGPLSLDADNDQGLRLIDIISTDTPHF